MLKRITALFIAMLLCFSLSALADDLNTEVSPDEVLIHGFEMTPESWAEYEQFLEDAKAQQASGDHSIPPIPYTPTAAAAKLREKYPDFASASNMCDSIDITPTAQLNGLRQPLSNARVLNLKTPQPSDHDHGGYYYVQSAPSATYSSAFARVTLPQVATQGRCAFISLGVAGQLGGVDMGITYTGDGWSPYFYDVAANNFYAEFGAHSTNLTGEAVYAVLNAAVVDATTVQWSVTFQDAASKVLDTFWLQSPIHPGNLSTDADGKVVCSFYRFASISHMQGADTRASMKNGAFLNCQLYDGSTYVPWGMADDTAASVWTVHPTCVDLSYSGMNDTFSIRY